MTAGSGVAGRPTTAGGHCRVTVVAPTRRVDVALPEDVPLAELLPELLRLVGDPPSSPAAMAAALTGYVLTGADGVPLDTATSLTEQGVVHGGVLRLRPADDVPEAAVHDDIADAVAQAVLAGGAQWSATALRTTALAVVGVAATLGAVVLWFSHTGTLHNWKGLIAAGITLLLLGLAVWRARYDQNAVGRGSFYGYGDSASQDGPSGPPHGSRIPRGRPADYHDRHDRVNRRSAEPGYTPAPAPDFGRAPGHPESWPAPPPPHGDDDPDDPDSEFYDPYLSFDLASFAAEPPSPRHPARPLSTIETRTVSAATATRAAQSVRDGGLGSLAAWPTVAEAMAWATGANQQRDYTAAAVLSGSSFPYAFIAGAGLLPAGHTPGHGLGRAHFAAGAAAVLIVALLAMIGLGRRIAVPVAGAAVGLIGLGAGIGLVLTKASPASGAAIVAAFCALVIEVLPFTAMAAARFVIEPPISTIDPDDFEGSPVNNYVVGLRVARTLDTLAGLTAGVGTVLVLSVSLLVVPIAAMDVRPNGANTVMEQALALLASGVVLCRSRVFSERSQVLAVAISGLTGLVIAFAEMSKNAVPDLRAMWLAPLLVVFALMALALASVRPRRSSSHAVIPPRWSRMVEAVEKAATIAVVPVLLAVLGVYDEVRRLKG
jgi:hypothetical protein